MTNLDSISKSRDITLPTKVRLVKAMVFPVVMYGCENWTVPRKRSKKSKVVSKMLSTCIASKYPTLNRGSGKEEAMAKIPFQKHPLDHHGNFQNVKEGLP